MAFSAEHFLQNFLENNVQTGMLVVDGRAGNGQKTRFLASRVGKDGMVLSFHKEREEANKTAASLFMAGLQERVTIENGQISEESLTKELGRLTKVDLVLLDYSKNSQAVAEELNADSEAAWPFLKDGGKLILLLPNDVDLNNWQKSIRENQDDNFSMAAFSAEDSSCLLFEKEAEEAQIPSKAFD
ncbi:hypothetical protein LQZ24_02170 [Fructobacillus sp. M1-13]|uniref:SAM-dependent methyltransferase n=1 Tax=Fructobacillus papyriferae TaxID=2713171 RepID=A0ABS5QR92_9LACO|nr:hypothetical protein [Fructobacillus papyriferae]MBS9334844.1 hypothetical protein [Fructobacillus papyriferae]MCD2158834.1 hypothetical protein [Fructobacillus papyriferae]